LKSPLNAIGGVGFFLSHTFLPMTIAWDAFRNRNGCETFDQFSKMILGYRGADKQEINPTIGCIVLTDPIFFREADWIETPSDWGKSIVQGKSYDSTFGEGKLLWDRVETVMARYRMGNVEAYQMENLAAEEAERYGEGKSYRYRIGQGAFRVLVTDAYARRCAITGEKTLPVLEAAHIRSFAENGPNRVSNGLFLRSDMHKLFDNGYLTVTNDYKIEVSQRIKLEFQNGKEYYQYHGQPLKVLPEKLIDRPDPGFVEWHNAMIFKG
jgi:putative restriction endonuclease